jgi:hypothetical protein
MDTIEALARNAEKILIVRLSASGMCSNLGRQGSASTAARNISTPSVRVHNQNGTAVANATVTGNWYFKGVLVSSGARATTNSSGQATLRSPSYRAVTGDLFTFRMTTITATGYRYASELNHATEGSVAAKRSP